MVMSTMILVMVIQPRSVADLFRGEFEEDQRWRLADWKRPRGADHVFYLWSQETVPAKSTGILTLAHRGTIFVIIDVIDN